MPEQDMRGIERRAQKGGEAFRAYVADPARAGRKLTGPWGTYEQALEWRRRALNIKAEAKRAAREHRAQAALERLEGSLRGRS